MTFDALVALREHLAALTALRSRCDESNKDMIKRLDARIVHAHECIAAYRANVES